MNKKILFAFGKSVGLNLLGGAIGLLPFTLLKSDYQIGWGFALIIIAAVSLIVQLIVALAYISSRSERKEAGKGMLLSVGLFILTIGLMYGLYR